MDFNEDGELLYTGQLGEWVNTLATEWRNHYRTKYEDKHEEYYRIWRGQWAAEDKTRGTERSKLIAPATSQAVESSTAEVEEACFGSGNWFDIEDDLGDVDPKERIDVEQIRNKLMEDFKYCKIRQACVEVLCNAAVTGTGVGELIIEEGKVMKPTRKPMDGDMASYGVQVDTRPFVKLNPVQEKHFIHDPSATCVDDALGVAVEEYVGLHHIEQLQDDGIYLPENVSATVFTSTELSPDNSTISDNVEQVKIVRYYGLVPTELLKEYESEKDLDLTQRYTEAVVVIANGGTVLKATKNPYMMCDRPVITFQWDVVPGQLRGRGVVEKAYNSQKALDAEIRARVDALALTVHPMMAMDATRLPRGFRAEVKPGKVFLTQGNPNEIMTPFKLGDVSQITFAQAAALQDMVQQSTGAIDSTGLLSNVAGAKTGAVTMSMAAVIKRHKRTVVNFQESFLVPLIRKAAWRYMQFDSENYPSADYSFTPITSLGTIGREAENQQLVGLLQTMGPDSPLYNTLVTSVVQNTSVSNKEKLVAQLQAAAQPNPQVQEMQNQMHEMELAFKQAQTDAISAQADESKARAFKYTEEGKVEPEKIQLQMVQAITNDLKDNEEDKSFDYRIKAMQELRKNAQLSLDEKKHNDSMRLSVINSMTKQG